MVASSAHVATHLPSFVVDLLLSPILYPPSPIPYPLSLIPNPFPVCQACQAREANETEIANG